MLSNRRNDVFEDSIAGRHLDGLAVHAALQELLSHIGCKAPLPKDDTCNRYEAPSKHVHDTQRSLKKSLI